ncbi:MAG: hypothetical protein AAFZ15_14860 [Bacteroidota bacterium]
MKFKILFSCFLLLAFFSQQMNAQEAEKKEKRKMTVVTKTKDKDGKTTTTTIVKEGDEISDEEIDKIIEKALGEGHEIDIEIEMEDIKGGEEKIIIKQSAEKGTQKKYKIIKKSQGIEVESDGDHEVINLDNVDADENVKEIKVIKKKDGKTEVFVEMKDEEGDGENPEKMIFIGEDGEVQELSEQNVKIIKKKSADGKNIEITIESTEGEADQMIWIEKGDNEEGDIIIIEEETTEEKDKDGKTIKKTVKKKKKIVKKEKE